MFAMLARLFGAGPVLPFPGSSGIRGPVRTNSPPPLPPSRPRRLSIAQSGSPLFSQRQSLFFTRLPGEIRALIYEKVLVPDAILHIGWTEERLAAIRCYQAASDGAPALLAEHNCCINVERWDGGWEEYILDMFTRQADDWRRSRGAEAVFPLPQLLLTCRRAYTEAISILYTHNTFEFRKTKCLRYFSQHILDERLQAIRKLHFSETICVGPGDMPRSHPTSTRTEWFEALPLLTNMSGLQELTIQLPLGGTEGTIRVLEILQRIRHVRNFTVILNRRYISAAQERLRDAPFKMEVW